MDVGHLTRDADLVAVEVVGLLADFSVFVYRVLIGETACMRTTHALRQNWKFCAGYGLLVFNYISTIFLHVMLEFVSK